MELAIFTWVVVTLSLCVVFKMFKHFERRAKKRSKAILKRIKRLGVKK
jgi:hypothetical protein